MDPQSPESGGGPGITGAWAPVTGASISAEIREHVESDSTTSWHPVNRRGRGAGAGPVAGDEANAHGIDGGFRVPDASIRPEIESGDTNAPGVTIGANAAGSVRAGRRLPSGE